jgi:hypothetical protein
VASKGSEEVLELRLGGNRAKRPRKEPSNGEMGGRSLGRWLRRGAWGVGFYS